MLCFHKNKALALIAVLIGIIVLTGCDRPPQVVYDRKWPPPPTPARIKLTQILKGPSDFGSPGFFEAIGQAIAGHRKRGMLRPQSVAIEPDKTCTFAMSNYEVSTYLIFTHPNILLSAVPGDSHSFHLWGSPPAMDC